MTQLPACRFNAKDIFSAFILVQRPVLAFRMVKRDAHVPGYNKLNTLSRPENKVSKCQSQNGHFHFHIQFLFTIYK